MTVTIRRLSSVAVLLPCVALLPTGCIRHDATMAPQEEINRMEPDGNTTLFEDSMAANWQQNWFLDGKKATVEHRDGGLYFAGGTVTKRMDPVEYHAHHAVLWTKQVFEGDLAISYEMTRVDSSDYGNTLLYVQAQGVGTPPYEEDIAAWNELREIPSMDKYFTCMSLISLSFRENLRCRRYPLRDPEGNPYDGTLLEPMADYAGIQPGKSYLVEVEKKNPRFTLRLYDAGDRTLLKQCTWDTSETSEEQLPRFIEKGRIGLRHMSTKQFIYRNFRVEQL